MKWCRNWEATHHQKKAPWWSLKLRLILINRRLDRSSVKTQKVFFNKKKAEVSRSCWVGLSWFTKIVLRWKIAFVSFLIADDEVRLLFGESLSDLLGGLHVVFNASHDAAVLPIPHHLGPEVPDATVEADLAHGVVSLEELSEGLLLVVADVDNCAGFWRHLGEGWPHERPNSETTISGRHETHFVRSLGTLFIGVEVQARVGGIKVFLLSAMFTFLRLDVGGGPLLQPWGRKTR